MLRLSAPVLSLLVALLAPGLALAATPNRAQLTGEVIDPWCYLSEIMYAEGTAHHQCAIWCAAGGIPVALLTEDGQVYFIVGRSEEHTSELQSLMRISYAVFCLKKQRTTTKH